MWCNFWVGLTAAIVNLCFCHHLSHVRRILTRADDASVLEVHVVGVDVHASRWGVDVSPPHPEMSAPRLVVAQFLSSNKREVQHVTPKELCQDKTVANEDSFQLQTMLSAADLDSNMQ